MWRRPRSWECGDFPYKEKAELMPPRSWGYSPSLESEDCVVGSLCMVRKMFPYKNMHVDYVRPRGTRWYASSSTGVIRQPSREMHPSTLQGSVRMWLLASYRHRIWGLKRILLRLTIFLGPTIPLRLLALLLVWFLFLNGLCCSRILILLWKYLYQLPLTPWSHRLCMTSLEVIWVFMVINCLIE